MQTLSFQSTANPVGALVPAALPATTPHGMRELSMGEIDHVSGGFVCGGLCIAGVGFAAGALFGSGLVIALMKR